MSQLNVDNIQNRTGSNGGPNFPSGITVAVGQTAYIHGNLQVDGTETIVNTETLNVADKTVGIGSTTNASNTTADGAGIEVFASSSQTGNNKTLTWGNTANSWEFGPNDVGLKVGVGVTIYGETGIVSATSFKGDGSLLSGIDATSIQTGNTSVQTVDTGSDGHVKMTTEGGERVRVGPAGQIGLGGANYGSSGQVITSAGNAAAPTWATIPPAGNTFTGIASGSIANDKAVMVCQDGKLAQVAATFEPATTYGSGHAAWMSGGQITSPLTSWNPRDEMVYACYTNMSGNLYVNRYDANVGSGGLTDLGDDGAIATSVNTGNESRVAMCYDTAKNQLFTSYNRTDGTNGWKYRIGTPNSTNNTGLDWGSQVAPFNSIYYAAVCYEPTQGKIVLLYRDDANGDDLYISVGEISDSTSSATITWGTAVQIDGTNNIDANSRLDICSCGSSRVLFSWTRTSNDTRCGAATITAGNGVTDISSSFPQLTGNGAFSNVAWDHSQDKGVVTYRDANTSDYGMGRLVTLGASNACTVGSQVAFKSGSYERGWSTYNAKIQRILMQYQSGGGSGETKFIQANISGSTLTWVNDGTYNPGTDSYGQQISSWNAADFSQAGSYGYVSLAKERASNNNGVMYVAIVVNTVSNLKNQNQYVGFAAQAYTDGQTATINTYGNNVSTLSGLTTSSLYYVQGDGTLAITADSTLSGYFVAGTPVAGTALNGTTLLIRDPATRV